MPKNIQIDVLLGRLQAKYKHSAALVVDNHIWGNKHRQDRVDRHIAATCRLLEELLQALNWVSVISDGVGV